MARVASRRAGDPRGSFAVRWHQMGSDWSRPVEPAWQPSRVRRSMNCLPRPNLGVAHKLNHSEVAVAAVNLDLSLPNIT